VSEALAKAIVQEAIAILRDAEALIEREGWQQDAWGVSDEDRAALDSVKAGVSGG
jgi:hypothetical protein